MGIKNFFQDPSWTKSEKWFFGVLCLINVVFRFKHLQDPIGWDEAVIFGWVKSWPWSQVFIDYSNIGNHIFHTLLTKASVSTFGYSLAALRLPVLIFGSCLAPLLYLGARKLYCKEVALIASVFVALTPWHVYWSVVARGYIIQSFIVLLWFFYTLLIFRSATPTKKQNAFWIILCVLAFYVLPTTLWTVPGFFAAVILDLYTRKDQGIYSKSLHLFKLFAFAAPIVALLYGLTFIDKGSRGEVSHYILNPDGSWSSILFLVKRSIDYFFWSTGPLQSYLSMLAIVALCWGLLKRDLVAWFLIPTLMVAFVISLLVKSVPLRAFTFLSPMIFLSLAILLHDLIKIITGLFKVDVVKVCRGFVVAVAAIMVWGIVRMDLIPVPGEEDRIDQDREVVEYISKNLNRGSDKFVGFYPQLGYWATRQSFNWKPYRVSKKPSRSDEVVQRVFFIVRTVRDNLDIGLLRLEREASDKLIQRLDLTQPKFVKSFGSTEMYYFNVRQ